MAILCTGEQYSIQGRKVTEQPTEHLHKVSIKRGQPSHVSRAWTKKSPYSLSQKLKNNNQRSSSNPDQNSHMAYPCRKSLYNFNVMKRSQKIPHEQFT